MTVSSRKALRSKQVETEDPLLAQLAETGVEDREYIDMLKVVQEEIFDIPKESELKKRPQTKLINCDIGIWTQTYNKK